MTLGIGDLRGIVLVWWVLVIWIPKGVTIGNATADGAALLITQLAFAKIWSLVGILDGKSGWRGSECR